MLLAKVNSSDGAFFILPWLEVMSYSATGISSNQKK